MHLISKLGMLKLEYHNFKACLGYIARTCLLSHKETNKQTNKRKETITKIQEDMCIRDECFCSPDPTGTSRDLFIKTSRVCSPNLSCPILVFSGKLVPFITVSFSWHRMSLGLDAWISFRLDLQTYQLERALNYLIHFLV